MTPLEAALVYARRRWPVFPCKQNGPGRKSPIVQNGFKDATYDETQIVEWWRRYPGALIGVPTGRITGFVVLDIDVKRPDANGFRTLARIGLKNLPWAPVVHTASQGAHIYFDPKEREIPNTNGAKGRGIGTGLDWRGEGGYVILPSPGSGYSWDRTQNFRTAPLAPIPDALLPREPKEPAAAAHPIRPSDGLSRYAEVALDNACRNIAGAPAGSQEDTLHRESFSIGTLAGAHGIPEQFARAALIHAARMMRDYDPRWPWRSAEIEKKVDYSFERGLRHPREAAP